MKTVLIWFFWLAVIVGVAWYFLHLHQTQVKKQRAVEIQQQQSDAAIAALALKYNAVTNWEALLPDRGADERPFSIDVSRALIQSNGQPVLIIMDLGDVVEKGGSYTAYFGKSDITNGTFNLQVDLKCTQEQANYLLGKNSTDYSKKYAVVARLEMVEQPRFRVLGSGQGEDARIEIDNSSLWLLANGVCVDLLRKGEIK